MGEEDALARRSRSLDKEEPTRETTSMECADVESAAWRATEDAEMHNPGVAHMHTPGAAHESIETMYAEDDFDELCAAHA